MALMGIFMVLVFSLLGLLIGWVWKPKWVSLGRDQSGDSNVVSKSSVGCLISSSNSPKSQSCSSDSRNFREDEDSYVPSSSVAPGSRSPVENEKTVLTMEDLDYLCQLVEVKDGGPAWIPMMDRSAGSMSYQAWRRDPLTGPPQYRSRTVYEDVTPELMRDFFWDDEFRHKWDNMLIHSSTLEECPVTGTMVVQWIRKFPFFCSDREYIIGRRIWESGRSYYCVTKGVPCTYIPRRNKPRRVDLYYSSWCIRAVESKKDGQLTACEVLLFHYEDMGIPWEIAKLGVRQGMWGCVKMIQPGLQAYQVARREGAPLSRSAFMAQINSKIDSEFLHAIETTSDSSSEVNELKSPEKQLRGNILKFLVVGGAVALACSLDRGLVSKAIIFGVARRFGNIGRKL